MQFKLDTKEKFHVIRIEENDLTANLSEEITKIIIPIKKEPMIFL
jgi:hypothetical protein